MFEENPYDLDEEPVDGEVLDMYDEISNSEGWLDYLGTNLEPDPNRWTELVRHSNFRGDMQQLDHLMSEYDHILNLQVGDDTFREVNRDNESAPENLNFYIAEDRETFHKDVNHRFFNNVTEDEYSVPAGSNLGFRFGSYRDTINVPEDLDYIDIRVPTRLAHMQKEFDNAIFNHDLTNEQDSNIYDLEELL